MSASFSHTDWNSQALLTDDEMRQAEKLGCLRHSADSFSLMQKAGDAVARVVQRRWQPCRVLVLCGSGNNGGDGYIAAEALRLAGWSVTVAAMTASPGTDDARRAAAAWQGETRPLDPALLTAIDGVVDALFGAGLKRAPMNSVAQVIEQLNASGLPVIAVDLPSGLESDTGRIPGVAVKAEATVTFFRKKMGHILLPGAALCGEVFVDSLDIDDAVLDAIQPKTTENHPALWRASLPQPKPEDHKYDRGHALVYGGPVMTGAARLAARAVQRMGAGLVTLAAPVAAVPLYAAALESVMVRPAPDIVAWRELVEQAKINALLVGPGMGIDEQTREFVLCAVRTRKPCVLDADALTAFANVPDALFPALHPACVLTPHEGEFVRLFGTKIKKEADKLTRAREAAAIAGCTVLLKGADTIVALPDGRAVVNHNAPPWLATAGAGDVLAGLITGLMASGTDPAVAAAAAAFVHGLTAVRFGPGLIAEDLVAGIPETLKFLLCATSSSMMKAF